MCIFILIVYHTNQFIVNLPFVACNYIASFVMLIFLMLSSVFIIIAEATCCNHLISMNKFVMYAYVVHAHGA